MLSKRKLAAMSATELRILEWACIKLFDMMPRSSTTKWRAERRLMIIRRELMRRGLTVCPDPAPVRGRKLPFQDGQ